MLGSLSDANRVAAQRNAEYGPPARRPTDRADLIIYSLKSCPQAIHRLWTTLTILG